MQFIYLFKCLHLWWLTATSTGVLGWSPAPRVVSWLPSGNMHMVRMAVVIQLARSDPITPHPHAPHPT